MPIISGFSELGLACRKKPIYVTPISANPGAMERQNMWKLIEPTVGREGAPKRTKPCVVRYSAATSTALLLPSAMVQANSADIYNDGTRLGLMFHDKGRYKVAPPMKNGMRRVTIPAGFHRFIPKGTTDCNVSNDGAMLVVDLAQFNMLAVAAE